MNNQNEITRNQLKNNINILTESHEFLMKEAYLKEMRNHSLIKTFDEDVKSYLVLFEKLLEEKDKLEEYGLIYDEIWLIYVNSDLQKDRLRKRAINENKNPEDVLKIIDKQISIEMKKTMVDEVIFNEGTIQELRKQIETLLMKYK